MAENNVNVGKITVRELHAFLESQIIAGYADDLIVVVDDETETIYGEADSPTVVSFDYDEENELVKITFGEL